MTVYLDLIVFLNFAVDFLLLISSNRLTGHSSSFGRCVLGAAAGGIYGGLCLLPGLRFLGNWIFSILCLILISVVSFGRNRSAVRRGALFGLLSITLCGIVSGLETKSFFTLILSGVGLLLLCSIGVADPLQSIKYVKVVLTWKGTKYPLIALADTGNTLKDPITGAQVLVVGPQIAEQLLQLSKKQLVDPVGTMQVAQIPGLRLLPYRSIGQPNGLLLGISVDNVIINGQPASKVIAFSPESFGNEDCYQALAGGVI